MIRRVRETAVRGTPSIDVCNHCAESLPARTAATANANLIRPSLQDYGQHSVSLFHAWGRTALDAPRSHESAPFIRESPGVVVAV